MNWMTRWPGGFPIFIADAQGATLTDVDGNTYRGVLMTPFHMMALMSPATTEADVDCHTELFAEAVGALVR